MVARVAMFEGVDVEQAATTFGEADRRVRPLLEALSGYRGYVDLGSESGRVVSVVLFDSDEDADAAEQTFDEEMPRALADLFEGFAGRRVSVERYRVLNETFTA
jgi:hypothetical protein